MLGSTEPHYTPSKVYQAVLSDKPVLAILHNLSTANSVIKESGVGVVLDFEGENDLTAIKDRFDVKFSEFMIFMKNYDVQHSNTEMFEQYSAHSVTGMLAVLLNEALRKTR